VAVAERRRDSVRLTRELHERVDSATRYLKLARTYVAEAVVEYAGNMLYDSKVVHSALFPSTDIRRAVDDLFPYAPKELNVLIPLVRAFESIYHALLRVYELCKLYKVRRGVCRLTFNRAVVKDVINRLWQIADLDKPGRRAAEAATLLDLAMFIIREAFSNYATLTGKTYERAEVYEYGKYDVFFTAVFLDLAFLIDWAMQSIQELKRYTVRKINDIELLVHPNADVDLVNAVKLWAETANALYKKNFILKEDYELLGATVHTDWAFIVLSGAERYGYLTATMLGYLDKDPVMHMILKGLATIHGMETSIIDTRLDINFKQEQLPVVAKLLAITPSLDQYIAGLPVEDAVRHGLSLACTVLPELCVRR